MEDFDDLLARRHAAEHFRAECLVFDPPDERLGDLEMHVRFQQSEAHLTHGVVDVGLADRALPAQVLEDILELVAELGKHGRVEEIRV